MSFGGILAGATRTPDALPLPTRIGGFGGEPDEFALAELERLERDVADHPQLDRFGDGRLE